MGDDNRAHLQPTPEEEKEREENECHENEIHMANCMACGAPNTQECDEECGRMVCRDATTCEQDCSTTCDVCVPRGD